MTFCGSRPYAALVVCGLALLAGCAPVGPDFVKPELEAPADWSEPTAAGLETTPNELVQWWRIFNDPVLDELVETARLSNNTLEIAGV